MGESLCEPETKYPEKRGVSEGLVNMRPSGKNPELAAGARRGRSCAAPALGGTRKAPHPWLGLESPLQSPELSATAEFSGQQGRGPRERRM